MSNASPPSLSPPPVARVTPNLKHALGGIFRLTLRRYSTARHWLTLAGLLALLAVMALGNVRPGLPEAYLNWTVALYVTFFVPLMAFSTAGGAMRDELKAGTVDYVFTRPVSRSAFVVFRYLSHLVCVQFDFLLALGVVLGVGLFRNIPGIWQVLPLLLLAQALIIAAFSAFGFLCGILTSRYVLIGLIYGAVVEIGLGQIPTQLNRIAMTQQVRGMLQSLLELSSAPSTALGPMATTALVLAFTVVMLAFACALFSVRELMSGDEA